MQRNLKFFVAGAALIAGGLLAVAAGDLTVFKAGEPIKSGDVNANFSMLKAALEAPIGLDRLTVGGSKADGKVLKLENGRLVWADDIVGNSGSTYTADGNSMALEGTTFLVKEGGINGAKLANSAVSANHLNLPLNISANLPSAPLTVRNAGGIGLVVETERTLAISASSTLNPAVKGESLSNDGLVGLSNSGKGVYGGSVNGSGVVGQGSTFGVDGFSANGTGVYGRSSAGYAAEFQGGRFGNGICYFAGGSGWSCTSDRNAKENFRPINPEKILEALVKLPITTWNMKGDRSKIGYLGPTAQDFKAAFGLGDSDKTINTTNTQGVALAAIQGLNQKLESENQALKARLERLEAQFARIQLGNR